MKTECEGCARTLQDDGEAYTCSYDCTFCADCARTRLGGLCPNCGGDLVKRPTRPERALAKYPASIKRVRKDHTACKQVA